ncbi:hypothetical protein [Botrimarina mediterranea]|uniref:Uncharacterized protein n=1 Tax=Botrimarina mediterranea TaxID=2528022 RepID=A0A518K9V9_9BACT|nr:hypothetical protein [Botrimarina mediterranea]QDV74576.1 hypothetical protein Spa11_27820 [Botrimarina mediterranea]
MAIEVECENCQKVLLLKDACAGKTGKCPYCKKAITVPAPNPAKPTAVDQKEPTDKQIAYAQSLGVIVPSGIRRAELSELIDEAKNQLPATENQKVMLRDLGVSFPDDIRSSQISMLIDACFDIQGQMASRAPQRHEEQLRQADMLIDSATDIQLLQELSNRGRLFFTFIMDDDEFRYQEGLPIEGRITWTDSLNEADVKYVISRLAADWCRDHDMKIYSDEFDGNPPELKYVAGELDTQGTAYNFSFPSTDDDA